MFTVDQQLIMHSPHTEEDTTVIYRGKYDYRQSVVYDPYTGWQGIVPTEWLRPDDENGIKVQAG